MNVKKIITDDEMVKLKNTFIKRSMIHTILKEDAEVYSESGKLLLFFRKKKLTGGQDFYDQVADFMKKNPTSNRGSASGSTFYNVKENPKINTSIIGYFDKWGPSQKKLFKKKGVKLPIEVRETYFIEKYPEKFKRIIPYIEQINDLYKKYIPGPYQKQYSKAKETPFKIANTAFTTITTNINFQTSIHKDTMDDDEGFGNLSVIEHGEYTGGETCLPQYGIGVDVREGDILFMDVHEWHGNLPIVCKKGAERLSVVCYLRKNIWKRTRNKTQRFMKLHLNKIRRTKKM
jgi:hypothetical protein